jgi:uncharacterized protein YyaL (SSP411 family)
LISCGPSSVLLTRVETFSGTLLRSDFPAMLLSMNPLRLILSLACLTALSPAADPPPAVKASVHTNRLSKEKSPYLLQHQHNPVDWYPWGDEAFARAKAENKPILLSIGYSTCHWCHVMERESFENEEIGKYLKEHFIAIKLDREERPDIDHVYMTAMQALGLGGGWPLNAFLTPDRQPFYGGTYFPPKDSGGKPGFLSILKRIADVWEKNPDAIRTDAKNITDELQKHMAGANATPSTEAAKPEWVAAAAAQFSGNFDEKYGGFSGAPKFPQPHVPGLILMAGVHTEKKTMVDQVLFTCRRMAAGGMYDQLGGGFSRYSVDAKWLVPHFEKMLYDNAQLIDLYLNAGLVSGDPFYHAVVRDILRYLFRDMTHRDGGFYSAEDADSEGQEGKFYCWTKAEMESVLSKEEAAFALPYFGITEKGNFEDHSHPNPLPNLNVLHVSDPERKPDDAAQKLLAGVKTKLFEVQKKRVRPHLDDKILTSWNGLMLGALARAAVILDEPAWLDAAKKNFSFVTSKMWDPAGKTFYHRWRDGGRDSTQLLNAYAFYLQGSIELYQATLDPAVLTFCIDLADGMIAKFYDNKAGGFYTSTGGDDLLFRAKDDHDGAEPSGNSMAVQALLRLAALTERKVYREKADATLKLYAARLKETPEALPLMLQAVAFASEEPFRAVIAGDPAAPETKALLRAAHAVYQTHRVILGTAGPVEPFAITLLPRDGKPTAYVCTGTSCQPPTSDPAQVRKSLLPPGLK